MNACTCEWESVDAGGGYFEMQGEFNPTCPEHAAGWWKCDACGFHNPPTSAECGNPIFQQPFRDDAWVRAGGFR